MKDGKMNECIECVKKRVAKRETELRKNPEYLEKDRKRGRDKYYRLNYSERKPTPEDKKRIILNYENKYPEKKKAVSATKNMKRPKGYSLHHWSYNQQHWTDVIKLKKSDHYLLHRFIEYDQNIFLYRNKKTGEILDSKESHIELLKQVKNAGN